MTPFIYPRARDASRAPANIEESLVQLPFFAGPHDPDVGWGFFKTLMRYEDWIARGAQPSELDPDSLPHEFGYVLELWPETFEYFRHAVREYMDRVWSDGGWFLVVRSLIDRSRHEDLAGYDELRAILSADPDRLGRQLKNARLAQVRSRRTENMLEWIEQMLEWYRKFFEIDSILWLLGVLGEFAKSDRVRADLFGGPTTTTQQGSLVNEVRQRLQHTPLYPLFLRTYDTDLRNAVTHNDYELIDDADAVSLLDHETDRRFTQMELLEQMYQAMSLEQAMLYAHQYIVNMSDSFHEHRFREHGIIDVTFNMYAGALTIVLYQLWCFYEHDSAGSWLDSTTIRFHREDDHDHVRLSRHSCSRGPSFVRALDEEGHSLPGWARVIRLPVAPDLDLGYQKLYRRTGHYEILGPGDAHIVRVEQLSDPMDIPCPHHPGP